ncbi:MAG: Fe-S cluster assembly ATPase SufC [Bacillota bacterium]|nr:Fe-S cluster assembly ATPase SufC [Bacillota bacterium]
MSVPQLVIRNLHASVDGNPILKGVNLEIQGGTVHAVMGPNGAGKSTLAFALAGHPRYEVTEGEVLLNGENILEMEADERAKQGLFLAFQYPAEVPGVTVANFLRVALNQVRGEEVPVKEFIQKLHEKMDLLEIPHSFSSRYLNDGFSGGEKKRNEMLQLAMLEPKMAVLDETDSGLDIDAVRIVAESVNHLKGPQMGVMVITHYSRILRYLKPDFVHVMFDGRIVRSGGPELAEKLEAEGYNWLRRELGLEELEEDLSGEVPVDGR